MQHVSADFLFLSYEVNLPSSFRIILPAVLIHLYQKTCVCLKTVYTSSFSRLCANTSSLLTNIIAATHLNIRCILYRG